MAEGRSGAGIVLHPKGVVMKIPLHLKANDDSFEAAGQRALLAFEMLQAHPAGFRSKGKTATMTFVESRAVAAGHMSVEDTLPSRRKPRIRKLFRI